MKNILLVLSVVFIFGLVQCKKDSSTPTDNGGLKLTKYPPVAVSKTVSKKVYVHLMPWFETPATNNGNWGQHWTMNNQDPNIVDGTGKRQIASYYYPLIGPYASSDKDIIEYQLLLMKLSGIDGVLIDWPTTINLYDYPKNLSNAEALISQISKVGLKYGIVYEDNNVQIAFSKDSITDKIAVAQNDMTYMQSKYFSDSSYIHIGQNPLLLVFGPQTFVTPSDWTSIFSVLSTKPKFLTLWYQHSQAGSNSQGEFAWVYKDSTAGLDNFYNNETNYGIKMGVSYPGFNAFYAAGGWGTNPFTLSVSLTRFTNTLAKAIQSDDCSYVQVATWNDYGEGTMIEPTREFNYGFLNSIQSALGVSYNQSNLELVAKEFDLRKKYANNDTIQNSLNQTFYYFVSLQITKATHVLDSLSSLTK